MFLQDHGPWVSAKTEENVDREGTLSVQPGFLLVVSI